MVSRLRIDQSKKTNVVQRYEGNFCFRYAFDRSADSIRSNSNGQDYLAVNSDKNRIAFVLCDGVSQSFFGDLAARLLGNTLIEWLWGMGDVLFNPWRSIEDEMAKFLDQLSDKGQSEVAEFQLPQGLPGMLTAVLENKRNLGSETTFTAGYVDFAKSKVFLAWMGDSCIRIWDNNTEYTDGLLGMDNFLTRERWSTHRGRVGHLHSASFSTSKMQRLMTYSDGLARLNTRIKNDPPSRQTLNRMVYESKYLAASDDVTFFELFLGSDPKWNRPSPSPPKNFQVIKSLEDKKLSVNWQPNPSVSSYDLVISSSSGWRIFNLDDNRWSKDFHELPQGTLVMAVRSWLNGEVSDWCQSRRIDVPVLSYAVPSIKPETPTANQSLIIDNKNQLYEDQIELFTEQKADEELEAQPKSRKRILLPALILILFFMLLIILSLNSNEIEPLIRKPMHQATPDDWSYIEFFLK